MYLLHDCSKQVTKETTFAEKLVDKIFFYSPWELKQVQVRAP